MLDALGSHAILGVVAWLVLLQILALSISVALPVLVGGWRMLAPASVVAVLPSLAAAPSRAAVPSRTSLSRRCASFCLQ